LPLSSDATARPPVAATRLTLFSAVTLTNPACNWPASAMRAVVLSVIRLTEAAAARAMPVESPSSDCVVP
jgi:hypothetical protein